MRQALLFFVPAGFSYLMMEKTEGMPISRLITETSSMNAFLKRQSAKMSFHDFKHDVSDDLRMSKISYDEVKKELRYLYIPSKHISGFPTVSHGGFSYSVCLSLAEQYSKHFDGGQQFSQTHMRYKAPIFVEKQYIIDVKPGDGQLDITVTDENDKLFALAYVKYAPKD